MRTSRAFRQMVTTSLLVTCGFGISGVAQDRSAHCRSDGPLDEAGHPHCCADGSMPDGVNMCWCDPIIVHGDYHNPEHEFEVQVPQGVAEILGCTGIGTGFRVSLADPEHGNGDHAMNEIVISGADHPRESLQKIVEGIRAQTSLQEDGVSDQMMGEPEETTMGSMPALRIRFARSDPFSGKILTDEILANNPHKDIFYSFVLISPADQYEKNERLFKTLVEGFRYVPSGETAAH